jgi:hypothetical protein
MTPAEIIAEARRVARSYVRHDRDEDLLYRLIMTLVEAERSACAKVCDGALSESEAAEEIRSRTNSIVPVDRT